MEIFFAVYYLMVLGAWLLIRFHYQQQYKQTNQVKVLKIHPTREKKMIVVITIVMLFSTILWVFTPCLYFAQIAMPAVIRGVGVVLSVFSTYFFYKVHKQLGKNWSPTLEIRQGHELVVTGVYKFVRHPMYASILLWWVGNIFITANFALCGIQIVSITIMLAIRLPDEELMMIEQFGEQYKDYCRKTKRFIPFIL